jgi:hypothetical protein
LPGGILLLAAAEGRLALGLQQQPTVLGRQIGGILSKVN